MALACGLFGRAPGRLGCRFVESSYLLTLGDLRPCSAWNGLIRDPQPDDLSVLEELNRFLLPRGLGLVSDTPGHSWTLYSLAGLQLRCAQCRLSWVPRYFLESWWPGFHRWRVDFWNACEANLEPGWGWFDEGFMLGYPDQAVLDYPGLLKTGWQGARQASIAAADRYRCGQPLFGFSEASQFDRSIRQTESVWSEFLIDAYATPEHSRLCGDPDFLSERLLLD